ncbi:outer-membrane lipoprotein carrier protein LolA [Pelagibacterales bacterium SAG-MED13]|nr:outer-membrane lipoprotein carrier protein LolA [Pelagibacterales bacterium SAG-MED13]
MKKILLTLFLILLISEASASIKEEIIQNLKDTDNLIFNFEQNINGKTQSGICTLSYPKKIFCEYNLTNKKTLVSNGRSIVIKTLSSYYQYPLERTPLNLILDKEYILKRIIKLEERVVENKFINYRFFESDYEINIFFDYDTYNLIGWQTVDIYQNLSITFLSSIIRNQKLKNNLFALPKQD